MAFDIIDPKDTLQEDRARLRILIERAKPETLRAMITEVYEPRMEWAHDQIAELKRRVEELEEAIQNRQVKLKIVVENTTDGES